MKLERLTEQDAGRITGKQERIGLLLVCRPSAHNRRNRCAPGQSELLNMLLVSMRLRDDDRSPTVLVPLPSILDFAQRNSLGVDTQFTASDIRQKLADGF
jgi:hypothetical protein